MAALSDVFVRVKPDTTGLPEEMKRDVEAAASRVQARINVKARIDLDRSLLQQELAKMKADFARGGGLDLKLGDSIKSAEVALSQLGQDASKAISSSVQGAVSTPAIGPIFTAALVSGVVVAAPAIGAAVGAAITAGVAGAGIGAALSLEMQDPYVKAAVTDLTTSLKSGLLEAATPFRDELLSLFPRINQFAASLQPQFRGLFESLSPILDKLATGLEGGIANALPGIQQALNTAEPLFDLLAENLPKIGDAITQFFYTIDQNKEGVYLFFDTLLQIIKDGIVATGNLIGILADSFKNLLPWAEALALATGNITLFGELEQARFDVNQLDASMAKWNPTLQTTTGNMNVTGDAVKNLRISMLDAKQALDDHFASLDKAASDTAKAETQAAQAVSDARHSEAEAEYSYHQALQSKKDAQKEYNKSLVAEKAAQAGMVGARKEAIQNLKDLKQAVLDAKNASLDTALSVDEAKAQLNALQGVDPSSFVYREAQRKLADAQASHADAVNNSAKATDKYSDAQKKGINGSDAVVAQQKKISDAHDAVAQAQRQEAAATHAVSNASYALAKSKTAITTAQDAYNAAVAAHKTAVDNDTHSLDTNTKAGRENYKLWKTWQDDVRQYKEWMLPTHSLTGPERLDPSGHRVGGYDVPKPPSGTGKNAPGTSKNAPGIGQDIFDLPTRTIQAGIEFWHWFTGGDKNTGGGKSGGKIGTKGNAISFKIDPASVRDSNNTWDKFTSGLKSSFHTNFGSGVMDFFKLIVPSLFGGLGTTNLPTMGKFATDSKTKFDTGFTGPFSGIFNSKVPLLFTGLSKDVDGAWNAPGTGIVATTRAGNTAVGAIIGAALAALDKVGQPFGVSVGSLDTPGAGGAGDPGKKKPRAHADGGKIEGPGGPRDDAIPAMLSNKEWVINADASSHYGDHFMNAVNKKMLPRFADGGKVNHGSIAEIIAVMGKSGLTVDGAWDRYTDNQGFMGLPHGGMTNHGKHMAVDFNAPTLADEHKIAVWWMQNYGKSLLELIHTDSLNPTVGQYIKRGKVVSNSYYGGEVPKHLNHVHVAALPGFSGLTGGFPTTDSGSSGGGTISSVDFTSTIAPFQAQLANQHWLGQIGSAFLGQLAAGMGGGGTGSDAIPAPTGGLGKLFKIGASMFGGPGDPGTGTHGYHGDSLIGKMAYAELSKNPRLKDFSALGGLPYKQKARISYNGKSVDAEKLDIGAGGSAVGGYARGVDLWYQLADKLGFKGTGVVGFQTYDQGGWLKNKPAVNATGKPEAVLTPEESENYKRMAQNGGSVDISDASARKIAFYMVQALHSAPPGNVNLDGDRVGYFVLGQMSSALKL